MPVVCERHNHEPEGAGAEGGKEAMRRLFRGLQP